MTLFFFDLDDEIEEALTFWQEKLMGHGCGYVDDIPLMQRYFNSI